MVKETIIQSDNEYHVSSSTRYSENTIKSVTFCNEEIEIESEEDYIHVPIRILKQNNLCKDCMRKIKLINYDRFPNSYDYTGEYKFIIRAIIDTGYKTGMVHTEVIPADNINDAKKRFEDKIYNKENTINYVRISKSNGLDSIETVYEN